MHKIVIIDIILPTIIAFVYIICRPLCVVCSS